MVEFSQYQRLIHLSRYARWDQEAGRRETYAETVDRYFDFFVPYLNEHHDANLNTDWLTRGGETNELDYLHGAIINLKVMPSMRCMMTAGPALARDHIAGYNCAYRPIDDIRAFDEILFILMCATGVGFSVERQYVNCLPALPESLDESGITITVRDSKRGWAEAYRELLGLLFAGRIPNWNTDQVRPSGARLMTMGGRASGPGPLIELFEFTVRLFKIAVDNDQKKLTSLMCHDLVCKIGECIVVGGVRRAALLSLSNLSDQRMRDAKAGEWWVLEPHRALSNNSVAYTEKPEVGQYMEEWMALYRSKSGERGMFNREAARTQAMKSGRREGYYHNMSGVGLLPEPPSPTPIGFGTNPCSEIILRPEQFCNLTTMVIRAEDDVYSLEGKARIAATLGTWQACLTNFRYVGKQWKKNCEEERLLGVSQTGIMVVQTNVEWAERLGINPSTAVTCVKPEGTASQLVGGPSGISAAYAEYYLRRIRQGIKDPLTQFLIDQGVPHEQDAMNKENMIFAFPQRSPQGAVMRDDMTAIEQLEHWKLYQDHWCEHKPSITVQVREQEWPTVGSWVWEHFDQMSGVAFLPYSDHIYKQAPFEDIGEGQYIHLDQEMPEIDWSLLSDYENEDSTNGHRELACVGGSCDI